MPLNQTPPTESERLCNFNHGFWKNHEIGSCSSLSLNDLCTTSGGYGGNWNFTKKSLTDFYFDGFTGWACPQCGCNG